MSKLINNIAEVIGLSKEMMVNEIELEESISVERAKEIIKKSFKIIAYKNNLTTGTIISNCSREIGLSVDRFTTLVIDYLTSINTEIIYVAVNNLRVTIDNPADVKSKLLSI